MGQYPADHNLLTNSSVYGSDSIYMMSKIAEKDEYTLCELKSWLSPNCSTLFDISGTAGARMTAHCEDKEDEDSYLRSYPPGSEWPQPELNWKVSLTRRRRRRRRRRKENPCRPSFTSDPPFRLTPGLTPFSRLVACRSMASINGPQRRHIQQQRLQRPHP